MHVDVDTDKPPQLLWGKSTVTVQVQVLPAYQQHRPAVVDEVWQISTLFCSSKQACSLQDQICICCLSGNWCDWHTTEMYCGIQQLRKRDAKKNPGKGGLLCC